MTLVRDFRVQLTTETVNDTLGPMSRKKDGVNESLLEIPEEGRNFSFPTLVRGNCRPGRVSV